jgi:hypothetical protein
MRGNPKILYFKGVKTMEENKVIETETAVEEVKKESKIGSFFKKHGKKIVAGAAIAVAGVVGVAIGKKAAGSTEYYEDDVYETTDFSEVDTNE